MHTGSNIINSTEGILTASRIELIGHDTTSLILSGQLATIILPVTAQSGSTVRVYRAQSI